MQGLRNKAACADRKKNNRENVVERFSSKVRLTKTAHALVALRNVMNVRNFR